MRMSIPGGIAACAIVAAVVLMSVPQLSTPAFAAKQSSVLAACKRTSGCWSENIGNGRVVGCSPNACFDCQRGNCQRTAVTAAGGSKVQRGPNAVVTPPRSSRGSTAIQTGPTAVITTPPVRPLGPSGRPGGNPCTVHCGPQGGRKR
jgi:hypothetical protein